MFIIRCSQVPEGPRVIGSFGPYINPGIALYFDPFAKAEQIYDYQEAPFSQ
jgi:hypothetical protein